MKTYGHIRYLYFRDFFGAPVTCIAARVNQQDKTITYAFSKVERVEPILWLKHRIRSIKSLGGIVPLAFYQKLQSYSRDFSKKRARYVACRKLNAAPKTVAMVSECPSAHEISRLVMQAILRDVDSPSVVIMGAEDWLHANVESRATLPDLSKYPAA